MASTVSGIKTGSPTTAGTPASVVSAIKRGIPKHQAQAMGPKLRSGVRI